ncbi:hypothetical protein [Methylocella sp.]|uniref:hypothetical protein n=1 Tax=Methylocella sp. TaxID=1978226 RepID=UPI003C137ABD
MSKAQQRHSRRDRIANRPPEGEAWAWWTVQMMDSAAYRALSLAGRKVIDRIVLEHMEQGGKENGRLKVTARDFKQAGVHWREVPGAVAEVEALGWAKRTIFGRRVCGEDRGASAQFRLTWLPVHESDNAIPPTNDWKRWGDDLPAAKLAAKVAAGRTTAQRKGSSRPSRSMMVAGRQHIEGVLQRGGQKTTVRGGQRNDPERAQRGGQTLYSTGGTEEKDLWAEFFQVADELFPDTDDTEDANLVMRSEAAGPVTITPQASAALGVEHIEPDAEHIEPSVISIAAHKASIIQGRH